jgi:hypothetical protein
MANRHQPLDLSENDALQRWEWRLQRVGWGIWGLVMLAALAGATGSGPLSRGDALSPDGGFRVEFERFARRTQVTQWKFYLSNAGSDPIELFIPRSLLDHFKIERIEPEPTFSQVADDGIQLTFATAAVRQAKVVFFLEYEQMGVHQGRVALAGKEAVTIRQFVYP